MPNNTRWKKSEEKILKKHWPWITSKDLQAALPLRTPKAIMCRASQKGLRKNPEAVPEIYRANRLKRDDRPSAA